MLQFFCGCESDLLTLEPDDDIVKEFKDKKKAWLLPKITTNCLVLSKISRRTFQLASDHGSIDSIDLGS